MFVRLCVCGWTKQTCTYLVKIGWGHSTHQLPSSRNLLLPLHTHTRKQTKANNAIATTCIIETETHKDEFKLMLHGKESSNPSIQA